MKYLGKATRVKLIYISPKWTIYKPWDITKVRNMSGIDQNVLYQPHCCIMTLKILRKNLSPNIIFFYFSTS